jgi:hypothetical protein
VLVVTHPIKCQSIRAFIRIAYVLPACNRAPIARTTPASSTSSGTANRHRGSAVELSCLCFPARLARAKLRDSMGVPDAEASVKDKSPRGHHQASPNVCTDNFASARETPQVVKTVGYLTRRCQAWLRSSSASCTCSWYCSPQRFS